MRCVRGHCLLGIVPLPPDGQTMDGLLRATWKGGGRGSAGLACWLLGGSIGHSTSGKLRTGSPH